MRFTAVLAAVLATTACERRREAEQEKAPTTPTTEAPKAPTTPTTEAPTAPTTEAPTAPTTEAPTAPTTEAPKARPTEPTAEAPTAPAPSATPGTAAPTERAPVAGRENLLLLRTDEGRTFELTDADRIRTVEQQLQAKGLNPGGIDGVADAQLVAALRDFQQRQGLVVNGMLDRRTAEALGLSWSSLLEGRATLREGAEELGRDIEEGVREGAEEIREKGREIQRETR